MSSQPGNTARDAAASAATGPTAGTARDTAASTAATYNAAAFESAVQAARKSLSEGGIPIGAALARGSQVIAAGHNERVQHGDPIAHGEMSALRAAGRQRSYRDTTLYTTLAPCAMCTGTIIQFKIPRVVVGEARTFPGEFELLRSRGVEVIVLDDQRCVEMMTGFQRDHPELWAEDIAEDSNLGTDGRGP
ncbi:nucleoside deaminase [Arthrobacter sp. 92]|uniref:nucleoside deaminase n=1 Tax=Arthrobacter sp. 92 TaxID=3418175 RepID=UPI003CFE0EA1